MPSTIATDQSFNIRSGTVEQLRELIEFIRKSKNSESALYWRIKELEDQLRSLKKSKRYWLVWEDKPETVVERCRKELPVLVCDNEKTINGHLNMPTNILIEGDNFHALSTLSYTHRGKIDLIYIDPPYNTGASDWKYNNDYVDSNDTFRHSKWLSMMSKRLQLAKTLLKETGVLICTIDENEHATLGLLLQEIFNNYDIDSIIIVHNPAWVQWKNFSYTHEFAYFVYPKWSKSIWSTNRDKELVSPLRDWGGTSARKLAKTCFYPIIIKDGEIIGVWDVCPEGFHPISANIIQENWDIYVYPIDAHWTERKWVFSRNSVLENMYQLFVKKMGEEYVIMRRKNEFTYRTVWDDKRYYANVYWSKLLSKIISTKFPFPKSLYAVQDCLKAVIHDKDEAVILDFFAWSWTTGHAVLELNKADDWKRQFILCTNNENNIAEEVTYPRIRNVIKGYSSVEGIPANLRYYRTDFIDTEKSIDDLRKKFIHRCTDLLQVRESCFDEYRKNEWTSNFITYECDNKVLAIVYNPLEIKRLIGLVNTESRHVSVYIFSMGSEIFEEEFSNYGTRVSVETIPDEILLTYKKIFGF